MRIIRTPFACNAVMSSAQAGRFVESVLPLNLPLAGNPVEFGTHTFWMGGEGLGESKAECAANDMKWVRASMR
jgi:hypothetical protein